MSLSEFEQKRYEKILQEFCNTQGPPAHLHDQLKWEFRIDSNQQTVVLFEIRPYFNDPSQKIESAVAKARFIKSTKQWKLYWMRGNLKWAPYEPRPEVATLEEFLKILKEDAYGCFFG